MLAPCIRSATHVIVSDCAKAMFAGAGATVAQKRWCGGRVDAGRRGYGRPQEKTLDQLLLRIACRKLWMEGANQKQRTINRFRLRSTALRL